MDEWKEGVWLGVAAFIVSILLMFAVVLGYVSKSVAKMQQNDSNIVTSMQEYRKWMRYDDVIVNQGDVLSCILENKTRIPAVAVTKYTLGDNPAATFPAPAPSPPNDTFAGYYVDNGAGWNSSNDYLPDTLSSHVPPSATYRAKIIKDANGAVAFIWFRRVT